MGKFAAAVNFLAMFCIGVAGSFLPGLGPAATSWWLSDKSLPLEAAVDRFVPLALGVVLASALLLHVSWKVLVGTALITTAVFWGHYIRGVFRSGVPRS